MVTEAGEDGDDERSAFLDRQMESERRKVRRLRRKKRETDCSTESSGEETETMVNKNMLSSSDTEEADNSSKVFIDDACKSDDPIFDAIIEAVKSGKLDHAMELLRSYASLEAFVKIGSIYSFFTCIFLLRIKNWIRRRKRRRRKVCMMGLQLRTWCVSTSFVHSIIFTFYE